MAGSRGVVNRIWQRRMLRYWNRMSQRAKTARPAELADIQADAKRLQRVLADIDGQNANSVAPAIDGLPQTTQWAHRPGLLTSPMAAQAPAESGTKLSDDVTLYHDCPVGHISLRQNLMTSPYEVILDILEFEGSYLSFAMGMTPEVVAGVGRNDLIRADLEMRSDFPLQATSRLNVKVGPNVEQINLDVDLAKTRVTQEFDLHYVDLEAQKISDIWVDLIFKKPEMNRIVLRDLVLSRRPRANV